MRIQNMQSKQTEAYSRGSALLSSREIVDSSDLDVFVTIREED